MGCAANGEVVAATVGAVVAAEPAAVGVTWSNVIPEAEASWLSCSITFGISTCFGIAFARPKMFADRTAGRACMKPVERWASICSRTAAVCFFRLAALERFGEMRAK